VLNVKQQIQLKNQKQFLQQPPSANNTIVPTNNNNSNTDKTAPITVNVTPAATAAVSNNNEQVKANTNNDLVSPLPSVSIQIQAPSIPLLLTPPTPPVISTPTLKSPLEQQNKIESSAQPPPPTTATTTTTSILQANDLNVINLNGTENSSSSSGDSIESSIDKSAVINKNKDEHVKENGAVGGTEEKLLENIESRISLIKEANCQPKQQANGIHKSELTNGHVNNGSEETHKETINDKENSEVVAPLVNGTNTTTTTTSTLPNESNSNTASLVAVADENSSSSTTSTLTSSSLSSTSENEMTSQENNSSSSSSSSGSSSLSKKRKLSSSNNDTNEMSASPKKKSLKINEMEEFMNGKSQSGAGEAENKIQQVNHSTIPSTNSTSDAVASSALATTTVTPSPTTTTQSSENLTPNQTSQNAQQATIEPQQTQTNNVKNTSVVNNNIEGGDYMCEWNNCKRLVLNH